LCFVSGLELPDGFVLQNRQLLATANCYAHPGPVTPTHIGTFACRSSLTDTKASKRVNFPAADFD